MVSSSNCVAIKNDLDIDTNEEYDETIFDDLITDFITNTKKSTLQTTSIEKVSSGDANNTVLTPHTTPSTASSSLSDPLFTDNILTQNDNDTDLNIQPTTTTLNPSPKTYSNETH